MVEDNSEVLVALSGAIEELARSASLSLVSVGSERRRGTGIVIDDKGHILTAGHVVYGLNGVEVGTSDQTILEGKVVGRNPYSDLALLEVPPDGLKPIELGNSSEIKLGQFVLALARANSESPSATSGIITGLNRHVGGWWRFSIADAIVTDARLNPGYSGGPLVDARGRMVGLNVAYVSNRGIAVPVDAIKKDIDRLVHGDGFKRAHLGIVMNTIQLPDEVTSRLGLEQGTGLMVLSVEPGSSAKKAGLLLGDVMVKFGNKPLSSVQDLESALDEDAIGRETKVTVLREEQEKELTVIPSVSD